MSPVKAAMCILLSVLPSYAAGPDSVTRAKGDNRARFAGGDMREAADFLVETADARMRDQRQGELARDRAVHPDVRAYGGKMVRDQAELLAEIRALAQAKGIALPQSSSAAKADASQQLARQSGEDFDDRFISMTRTDHQRDATSFRRAMDLADPDVSDFARRRLPMIEEHLREVRALEVRH